MPENPDDNQVNGDFGEEYPEKVDEVSEYTETAPGQYAKTGLSESRFAALPGRLEGRQRTLSQLHCCGHINRSNAVSVCAVGRNTICDRPECTAWCRYCRNIVCRRHYTLDEQGIPVCDKCLGKTQGPDIDIRIFIVLAVIVLICAYLFLK